MRHRDEGTAASRTVVHGVSGTLAKITEILSDEQPAATTGKHKLRAAQPLIPVQKVPSHESVGADVDEAVDAAGTDAQVQNLVPTQITPEAATELDRTPEVTAPEAAAEPAATVDVLLDPATIPASVQWKAGHGSRMFAACLLLLAVGGTSALGLRYAETRGSDEFLSVVIGVGVVVGLWALLIASTPQVVSLRGSMLTIRNSSGSERFDLADGLQPVDVVGEPGNSHWALLLHRSNNTSVVLRRRDVDAVALDPIVRHYRALAEQRYAERQARFSR